MNYTKGEWTIQELPHDFDFRSGKAYAIRDNRNCCLATVGDVDAIFDGEESQANARLIAAAPDMYEALRIAIRALQDNDIDESMAGEFEILTDAISKAEGRIE